MKGDERLACREEVVDQGIGPDTKLLGRREARPGSIEEQTDPLQWTRKLHDRRLIGRDLKRTMRTGQKSRLGAPGDVIMKDRVRIMEVGNDHAEIREVCGQFGVQVRTRREEWRQSSIFDGTDTLSQAIGLSQPDHGFVAENLHGSLRKGLAHELEGRQSEYEVSHGATADEKNLAHSGIDENQTEAEGSGVGKPQKDSRFWKATLRFGGESG